MRYTQKLLFKSNFAICVLDFAPRFAYGSMNRFGWKDEHTLTKWLTQVWNAWKIQWTNIRAKKIEQHIVRTEWNADRSSLDIPTHTWRRNLDLAFTSRSDRKAWFITILLVLVGFFCVLCRVGVTAVYFRSIGGFFLLLCMPNSLIFHTLRLVKFCCLCNASHFLKNLRCLISQSKHKVRCEVKICSIWFIRAHIILNQLWRCRSQKLIFFLAAKKFPRKKQRRHLIVWHRTVSSANRPFLFEQEWTFALIAIDKPSALWCFFYFTYRRVTSTEIR